MKRVKSKIRRQIAAEAGRLLFGRMVGDYRSARQKAVEKLALRTRLSAEDLPTDREIRRQIRACSIRQQKTDSDFSTPLHLCALRVLRAIQKFHPRVSFRDDQTRSAQHDRDTTPEEDQAGLDEESTPPSGVEVGFTIVAVWPMASEVEELFKRRASAIPVDVGNDVVSAELESDALGTGMDPARARRSTWRLMPEGLLFELVVLGEVEARRRSASDLGLSAADLEMLVAVDNGELDLTAIEIEGTVTDRLVLWSMLLSRLEGVKQDRGAHPEGDALYHSLQAFELARAARPYDIELISACLLHDVGKAVDPRDHVAAGLAALAGSLSSREEFLVGQHMNAQLYYEGVLPQKLKLMLRNSEWFEDLMTLREINEQARRRGVEVCAIEDAISYIEKLESELRD